MHRIDLILPFRPALLSFRRLDENDANNLPIFGRMFAGISAIMAKSLLMASNHVRKEGSGVGAPRSRYCDALFKDEATTHDDLALQGDSLTPYSLCLASPKWASTKIVYRQAKYRTLHQCSSPKPMHGVDHAFIERSTFTLKIRRCQDAGVIPQVRKKLRKG